MHDPPEPTRERGRVSQFAEAAVRLDERFLGSILGQMEIAKHRVGIPIGHVLEPLDDCLKRVHVAQLDRLDQFTRIFHTNS